MHTRISPGPIVAFTMAFAASLHAQQQKGRPSPAAAAPTAPAPTTALPTPNNKRVSIVALYLDRASVKRAADALPAAKKPKGPGILKSLQKTVEGDKNVIDKSGDRDVLEWPVCVHR